MQSPQDELAEHERRAADLRAMLAAHPDAQRVDGEYRAPSLTVAQCNGFSADRFDVRMWREFGPLRVYLAGVLSADLLWRIWESPDGQAVLCREAAKMLGEMKKA